MPRPRILGNATEWARILLHNFTSAVVFSWLKETVTCITIAQHMIEPPVLCLQQHPWRRRAFPGGNRSTATIALFSRWLPWPGCSIAWTSSFFIHRAQSRYRFAASKGTGARCAPVFGLKVTWAVFPHLFLWPAGYRRLIFSGRSEIALPRPHLGFDRSALLGLHGFPRSPAA